MPELQNASRDHPTRGFGAVALTLSGLVAAFGVASCCGLPVMLATLGLGTAWLGAFALLAAPHRLFLLAVATFCLAGAAALSWRQHAAICVPGAVCTRPAIRGATMIGLLAGLVLLYLGYTYA
jgi:mercuric ion transport protein